MISKVIDRASPRSIVHLRARSYISALDRTSRVNISQNWTSVTIKIALINTVYKSSKSSVGCMSYLDKLLNRNLRSGFKKKAQSQKRNGKAC